MISDKEFKKIIDAKDSNKLVKVLFSNYRLAVFATVKKYGGNKHDAQDVFHDVVMVLLQEMKKGNIAPYGGFKSYIYTIAKNLWLNKQRKTKRIDSVDEIHELAEVQESIERVIFNKEKENEIKAIMEKLGEKCAKLLKAIVLHDKSYQEIMVDMEMANVNVVKSSKNRCKNNFIALIKENADLKKQLLRHEKRFGKYFQ